MKKLIVILFVFLILSNLPPVKSIPEMFFGGFRYYTTLKHGFNDSEYVNKGRTYEMVMDRFDSYKKTCNNPDITLYRTFKAEPYKFWMWGEYLFHPKYKLPLLIVPNGFNYDELNFRCK